MRYKMSENNSSPSATDLFLGVASVGAGAYHGFCDAQGIPLPKENLEWALTYAPAIVQGGLNAIRGGLVGLVGGGAAGGPGGAAAGIVLGAGFGGAVGGIKGGLQTLVGYGLGYFTGYIIK